jgi:hypothetical protein
LIVDADTVLPKPITVESFEAVTRWNTQIVESFGSVDREKLGPRSTLNLGRQHFDQVTSKQRCCALVGEAPDHRSGVPENGTSVKLT